jgi:tetratricopeptide (TPR) repeat protein
MEARLRPVKLRAPVSLYHLRMREADIRAAIDDAVACFNSGNLARAEEIYRLVVSKAPNGTRCADLGVILQARGKYDEAVALLEQAVKLEPKSPDHYCKLGHVLHKGGRTPDALRALNRAIGLNQRHADTLNQLGCVHMESGEVDQSIAHLQQAISANPRHYHAHNNLGLALTKKDKHEEAIRHYRQAIALDPNQPAAYTNLGTALFDLDQIEDAIRNHQKAVALSPAYADAHYNLANACLGALRLDDAIASYERAMELSPQNAGYRWNYANALLLAGNFAKGWAEYESRWRGSEMKDRKPVYPGPEWRGEDIAGKTLLTYAEQGFGDAIQFIRYAPLVAERGAKLLYACQPELARLLTNAAGVHRVIPLGQPLPRFDVHLPLLSLPRVFATESSSIPARIPYIRADSELVRAWQARMGEKTAFRVGLIWGGRVTHRLDRQRSCALADFAGLARLRNVQFYSLQKGEQAVQAKSPPPGMSLTDWSNEIKDFADVAALMENLDLIISVDTAGAHLAGALGKPVWLLNRNQTEWRWLLAREDSPWYPTMRIFRQPGIGDWKSVMEKVVTELAKLQHTGLRL